MIGRGGKLQNGYQATLASRLYAETPKAVFAAIAVALLVKQEPELEHAFRGELNAARDLEAALLAEWATLYANGIVPQRAPGGNRHRAAGAHPMSGPLVTTPGYRAVAELEIQSPGRPVVRLWQREDDPSELVVRYQGRQYPAQLRPIEVRMGRRFTFGYRSVKWQAEIRRLADGGPRPAEVRP